MKIHDQHGRTLIELMVAIAISLIITAVVTAIFLSVNRTARYSGELSNVEDAGRVAMLLMGNAIRQAGYAEIVGRDINVAEQGANSRRQTLLADALHLAGCRNGSFAANQAGLDAPVCPTAPGTAFDALMVSYQGGNVVGSNQTGVTDCLGNNPIDRALPAGHVGRNIVASGNRPMVQNFYFVDDNTLMCRAGNANAQALIPNVQEFRVYYGFDDTRYNSASPMAVAPSGAVQLIPSAAQTYVNADFLNAEPDRLRAWDHVISVYVCLVVRSTSGTGGLTAGLTTQFAGCPDDAEDVLQDLPMRNNTDGGVYRTYSQVFTVRSRATSNPSSFAPI
jgi:type IV pilus assembly protein PilW